jgi:cell division septum initiation protein DivIVA
MATYAEMIADLREKRETVSTEIEHLRTVRDELSRTILALEEQIRPVKKVAAARSDDVVMPIEPANLGVSARLKE